MSAKSRTIICSPYHFATGADLKGGAVKPEERLDVDLDDEAAFARLPSCFRLEPPQRWR